MSLPRLSDGVRLGLSLTIVLLVAITIVGYARWVTMDLSPSQDSDLGAPSIFGSQHLEFEDLLAGSAQPGVPILCYHYFRPGLTPNRFVRVLAAVLLNMPTLPDRDFWTTTVPEFEREMKWLADNGYRTVDLHQVTDWVEGTGDLPEKSVVITMDDGDESVVDYAVPILRRYGFRATLFLVTGRAGQRNWNDLDLVDWDTLRRLEREGVLRVESHSHRMHTKVKTKDGPVPTVVLAAFDSTGAIGADSPLVRDLRASRAAIRRELGHEASFVAWPFGWGTAATDSVALSLGFRRTLTLRPERNTPDFDHPSDEPHLDGLGRYAITARTSFRLFRLMVERTAGGGAVPD